MKIMRVRDFFDPEFREHILGPSKTGSRGTYLVYGEVEAGKAQRISPGEGHEEIVMVVEGLGRLHTGEGERAVMAGEAFYCGPAFSGRLHAEGDRPLRYVSAGGHVPGGHGH